MPNSGKQVSAGGRWPWAQEHLAGLRSAKWQEGAPLCCPGGLSGLRTHGSCSTALPLFPSVPGDTATLQRQLGGNSHPGADDLLRSVVSGAGGDRTLTSEPGEDLSASSFSISVGPLGQHPSDPAAHRRGGTAVPR